MIVERFLSDIIRSREKQEDKKASEDDLPTSPSARYSSTNAIELDVLGILDGGDKASVRGEIRCSWDYYRHYARFFDQYKDEPINVVEIGVAGGSSLNTWSNYFTAATIVGIDIEPVCARSDRGQIKVRIGSQDDPDFLNAVTEEFPPTIVIDDGSHQVPHIIKSFEVLFPILKDGGVYVVEDLALHFVAANAEIHPIAAEDGRSFFGYFSRFMAAKAAHVDHLEGAGDQLNELYSSIDEISIAGGIMFIRKRAARQWDRHIQVFERHLRERARRSPEHYRYAQLRYAEFLVTYGVDIKRADELLTDVLRRDPENAYASSLVSALGSHYGKEVRRDTVPSIYCAVWMNYPHH